MTFSPMVSAPTDGTWIRGRDEDGNEAVIQSRPVHPSIPEPRVWFVGDPEVQGHWEVSKCFYPVEWAPR